jgi:hypothetical protein
MIGHAPVQKDRTALAIGTIYFCQKNAILSQEKQKRWPLLRKMPHIGKYKVQHE